MCKSNPCVHGTCFDNKDGFVCSCAAGFKGKYCNTSKYLPSIERFRQFLFMSNEKNTTRKCLDRQFFKLKVEGDFVTKNMSSKTRYGTDQSCEVWSKSRQQFDL
jgi:hypothetical protein